MSKKKTVTLQIPIALANLLVAEPEDYKEPARYEEGQEIAKASLRLLIEASK